jgi:hypothetical protein
MVRMSVGTDYQTNVLQLYIQVFKSFSDMVKMLEVTRINENPGGAVDKIGIAIIGDH